MTHEQLIERCKAQGCSFLCFRDHNVYTDLTEPDEPGFISLPGAEWSSRRRVYHDHGVAGTREIPFEGVMALWLGDPMVADKSQRATGWNKRVKNYE